MQDLASAHTDQFAAVLSRFPPDLDLDRLALEHKALERRRVIGDGATLLRLALARGPGGLSLREAAGWASQTGLAVISNPGLKYRLDKAAGFLGAVVEQLLAARAPGAPPLWPGRVLRVADGSTISKRASKGTDWRVHGVFDLGRGGFSHLELTDVHSAEALSRGAPVAGEVRMADRGYARGSELHEFYHDGALAADFIVRLRWNGMRLWGADGKRFDLIGHLRVLPADETVHELTVQAEVGPGAMLPLRLVIQRKTEANATKARAATRARARQKQQRLDPRTLVAADFMVLATSLPAEAYPATEVLGAYRLRWQIELAFKRLKSLLHIDKLPALTERGARSWLLAHLILALLCDELSQEVLDSFP